MTCSKRRSVPGAQIAWAGWVALIGWGSALSAAQLPIPCGGGNCGAAGPAAFVTSGAATASQAANTLTVQQSSAKTILNWSSFNVGVDGKVIFQQPASTSIALNRIFDVNPSTILGSVNSNGQIYLINPNGFVFGSTAQVNTAGLIAASLGISSSTFNSGLLSPQLLANQQAALSTDPTVLAANGNPQFDAGGNLIPGTVSIAQGAQITATSGGRLLFAAPTLVQNAGTLQAPDGQVVLAAGQKVYLQASNSPDLRGLVVEVDQGGTAWNQLTGALNAARGNVTMVGLAVNQDGRISATTTVNANGSVRLEASDGATNFPNSPSDTSTVIQSTHGGTLEMGPQSRISVLPELADTATAVPAQAQLPSEVRLLGEQIFLDGGSILAPGGQLTAVAAANPGAGSASVVDSGNSGARIRVDAGSNIDLSGSVAELPMSANLVTLQLRSNELADDPTQRNGPLRGSTVTIDARVGTAIASVPSVQAAIAAVPQNIDQRTETGGSAQFVSEGDVALAQGASINVSGGQTTFDGGIVQTTQLIGANGRLYDIGTANPLTGYVGVLNPTFTQSYNKWGIQDVVPTPGLSHYESGYVQGAAAGRISIAAPALVLNGQLVGHAVNGPYQRTSATMVGGGQLTIGVPGGLTSNTNGTDYLAPPILFAVQPIPTAINDAAAVPAGTLQLPVDYLVNGGFTSTAIYDNTRITVPAGVPLDLNPGSILTLWAPRVDVLANITDLAGAVQLRSVQTVGSLDPTITRAGVQLGDGVAVDVSGAWINDALLYGTAPLVAPTLQNAGSLDVELTSTGGELVLGSDVALHASGGAWVNGAGKVADGKGGTLTLLASPAGSALEVGSNVAVDAFGVGTAAGGTFNLSAPRLLIGSGSAWTLAQRADDTADGTSVFRILAPLYSDYGFSAVILTASGLLSGVSSPPDGLSIAAGTQIGAITRSWQLDSGYLSRPTGGSLAAFASAVTLPEASRPVENVSFAVQPDASATPVRTLGVNDVGLLDMMSGARIVTDPGAAVRLAGVGGVMVNGTIRAPGGTITLQTLTPSDAVNTGYLAELDLALGDAAVLDVSGVVRALPNDLGLQLGSVLGGGSVNLLADRGSVLTQPGSLIDFSGTGAALDVSSAAIGGHYTRETLTSAGGALVVHAPESIALLGTLQGAAGTGGSGQPSAGSLEVDLTRSRSWFDPGSGNASESFPISARQISVISGNNASGLSEGQAIVSAAQLGSAGIDALRLEAGDGQSSDLSSISFATNLTLSLGRQLVLDAPTLALAPGVNVSLHAPYVALGNSLFSSTPGSAQAGDGLLNVSTQTLDLIGASSFSGVGAATLASNGDILLRGPGTALTGSLSMAGNLTLNAARIYPASGTDFALTSLGAGNTIAIGQTQASPGTPLSAAGSLTISADQITSSGTLLAPFGAIDLEATSALTLARGSLTSVSASGLILPYGSTELQGAQWFGVAGSLTALPSRIVTLHGAQVTLANGATVDVSGGGDLYAYEWVPGTGGTNDNLANGAIPGLYAVLPSLVGQSAPFDALAFAGSNLSGDARVYLSGVSGLPAGLYPLLPARYGLLPGARLVQVQSGFQNIIPGQQASLSDGTPVVAGYFAAGATGLFSGQYSGFAVWPSSYARALSGYADTYASSFFPAVGANGTTQAVTADAGRLSIDVATALTAAGQVLAGAASGGHAGQVDVSATQLDITASAVPVAAGVVDLPASTLQQWGAGNLVLGGKPAADNSSIAVTADSVSVGAGVQLSADQILLLANQSIDVQAGATLTSTSAHGSTALTTLPAPASVVMTGAGAAGAAVLAVSDQSLIIPQRPATLGALANSGIVTLESGATIGTRGALSIDAPGGASLVGSLGVSGASVSLAAPSIGVLPQSAGVDALSIDGVLLSALEQASAIRLASQGPINFYAPFSLGASGGAATPGVASLSLLGSSLNNLGGGDVTLSAQTVQLQGAGSVGGPAPVAGGGTFNVLAGEIDVGPGVLTVGGFGQTNLTASAAVVGQGAGSLTMGGNVAIATPELTAAPASQTLINTPSGAMSITALPSTTGVALPTYLGGSLTLAANGIQDNGVITVRSGLVALQASQDLILGPSATITAGGALVQIQGQSAGSAGGSVNLSAGGQITAVSGSTIDVSGIGTAPAGTIVVSGAGPATLAGTLLGGAGGGAPGGGFALQAGTLATPLDTLAATLRAGGFTNQVAVEVASGDLQLGAGAQLLSNRVNLTADSGIVSIGGVISAPTASQRGQIDLFGGSGVVLGATGQLHADGTTTAGQGGTIELGTGPSGTVSLLAGGVVSATGAARAGTLWIRAPASGSDLAVTTLSADVSGVGQVIVEPVEQFAAGGTLGITDYAAAQSALTAYMTSAGSVIAGRLIPTGALPLLVQPGVEFDASGSLTVTDPLDLSTWRFGGQPVDLTIRASGALQVLGTLSDGFVAATTAQNQPTWELLGGPSSSIRLVAGANLASADPLAVLSNPGADLTMGPGVVVRSGSGALDLVAAHDVVFAAGAQAYTAGLPAVPSEAIAKSNSILNFATDGGDLLIRAGNDVQGSPVSQSIADWLVRQGNTSSKPVPVQWGADVGAFGWNAGTLGGGDLTVAAGRNIVNLSAAASDSRIANSDGSFTAIAGGGLAVAAGGDIGSGQFYAADGVATLTAGGGFTAVRQIPEGASIGYVGSLVALDDAQVALQARLDVSIDAVVNPTTLDRAIPSGARASLLSGYFTYGGESSLTIQSTAGSITMTNDTGHLSALMGQTSANGFGGPSGEAYPATFIARSLQQNVVFLGGGAFLFPSDQGQLQLLAGKDIVGDGSAVVMSDAFGASLPTPAAPGNGGSIGSGLLVPFASGRHQADGLPALVTAGRDITNLTLSVPKQAQITAGRDITDLIYHGQNLNSTDLTLVSAGRNFSDSLSNASAVVQVGGPGRLDVLAGGTVDLGISAGITTVGNQVNPNLQTATGADLNVLAGLGTGATFGQFLKSIIEPSAAYQQDLVQYTEALTGQTNLTGVQADQSFAALSVDQQRPFIDEVFFDELRTSGREANSVPGAGFTRGYAAIDALFPNSRTATLAGGASSPFQGNIDLTFSRVYTTSGGTISLLAPGGAVNVGLANAPPGVPIRTASQLGIVAQGAGDVDIYSKSDVLVNSSRIFTLGGGNVLIWSDEGNIDAGRGSKSSISAPPPQLEVDSQGNVTLNLTGAVAGSGIRTIQIDPNTPPGNVDLIAPVGTVNAGDAGIGAAGNINIAAQQVVGLDNIQFGGASSGVPSQVSNLGASLAGASAAASSTSNAASSNAAEAAARENATPLAQSALSWLEVFVTGLGEENCRPDDTDCLRRQKTTAK